MADGTIEVVKREFSDTGLNVGRDVRAVNRAHGRIQRQAACKRLAARLGVAGGAIGGHCQVSAAFDRRRIGGRRLARGYRPGMGGQ